jgi:hypothetical protein
MTTKTKSKTKTKPRLSAPTTDNIPLNGITDGYARYNSAILMTTPTT